ncbi:CUE domain-containing protein [Seiridium cupressi]
MPAVRILEGHPGLGNGVAQKTESVMLTPYQQPPITFQPLPPPASPTPSSQAPIAKAPTKPAEPDLITRYNLQSKVSQSDDETADGKKGWSSNRDERQSALQRRRDEMIIAARKKMEEKIRAEKEAGKSS